MNKIISFIIFFTLSYVLGISPFAIYYHYFFQKEVLLEVKEQEENKKKEVKSEEKETKEESKLEEKKEKEEEKEEIKEISNHWITTWKGELFFIAVSVAIGLIVVLINFLCKKIKPVINNMEYNNNCFNLFFKDINSTSCNFILYDELNKNKIIKPNQEQLINLTKLKEGGNYEKKYYSALEKYNNKFCEEINKIKKEINKITGDSKEIKKFFNYKYYLKKNHQSPIEQSINELKELKRDFLFDLLEIRTQIRNNNLIKKEEALIYEIKIKIGDLRIIEKKECPKYEKKYITTNFINENNKQVFFEELDEKPEQDWRNFNDYDYKIFNTKINFIKNYYDYRFPRFFEFFNFLNNHIKKIFFVTIGVFEILLLPLISAYKIKFGKKNYWKRLSSIYCHSYKFIIDIVIAIILITIDIVLIKNK